MRFGATSTARPQWLYVGLGLAIVVFTYLFLIFSRPAGLNQSAVGGSGALIALVGYVLGAGFIISGVARQFTTSTYALIPIAIAINIVVGQITSGLQLPVYLDSIGTVLVGVLVGPFAGAATGGLANIIWGFFIPVAMPFAVVAIVIGLLAGLWTRIGFFRRAYLVPIAGLLTGIIAAFLSSPLSAFIFGGVTDNAGNNALVAAFRSAGFSILESATYQGLIVDSLDKTITFYVAFLLILALPSRVRTRFSLNSGQALKVDNNPSLTPVLAFVGALLGGFVAFLLRPSLDGYGRLPFANVLLRGGEIEGVDPALIAPVAVQSFNIVLTGAVVGLIVGIAVGYFLSKRR